MARTKLSIYKRICIKLGCAMVASLSEDSEQRYNIDAVWDDMTQEVMEAKDWRFARTRVKLAGGGEVTSLIGQEYDYAYQLPSNFLRLTRPAPDDPPVYPESYPYGIEVRTVTDGVLGDYDVFCLCTDYDNSGSDLEISYIKLQSDYTLWTAHYTNAFAARVAWEIFPKHRENRYRRDELWNEFERWVDKAEGLNQSYDYLKDETGSKDWVNAGRSL